MSVVLLIATVGLARRGAFGPAPPESHAVMSTYPLPADLHFFGPSSGLGRFAPSPDGRMFVFQAVDPSGTPRLWLRRLESLEATPIPGTDRGFGAFWSPDSRSIAFTANGQLKRVDLTSGVPTVLAESTAVIRGTWGPDGTILFNRERAGLLYRISAAEPGTPVPATSLPRGSGQTWQNTPSFLPDGRHFLFAGARQNLPSGIYVGSLDGGEAKPLLSGVPNAAYSQGYLLFVRDSALVAQPFDTSRFELTGQASTIVEDLEIGLARTGAFAVSESGLLVFQHAHGSQSQLEWVDRTGAVLSKIGEPVDQIAPSLSPDDARAAASILDPARRTRDIWVYDLKRGGVRTRLTSEPGDEIHSVWSADASMIVYSAVHDGLLDLYKRASSGAGRVDPLLEGANWNKYPTSWSRDGSSLLFFNGFAGSRTSTDLWLLPLATRTPVAIAHTEFAERSGRFSWDARWIAYESDESGRAEIYVMPSRGDAGKVRVSRNGGVEVCWRNDDRELYYVTPDDRLVAVDVDGRGSTVTVGESHPLFATHGPVAAYSGFYPGFRYQAASDGQHFLLNTPLGTGDRSPITFVVNWPALLSRR